RLAGGAWGDWAVTAELAARAARIRTAGTIRVIGGPVYRLSGVPRGPPEPRKRPESRSAARPDFRVTTSDRWGWFEWADRRESAILWAFSLIYPSRSAILTFASGHPDPSQPSASKRGSRVISD